MYSISQIQVPFKGFDMAARNLLQQTDLVHDMLKKVWSERVVADTETGFLFPGKYIDKVLFYQFVSANSQRLWMYFTTENNRSVFLEFLGIDNSTVELTLYAEETTLDPDILDLMWGSDSEGLHMLFLMFIPDEGMHASNNNTTERAFGE